MDRSEAVAEARKFADNAYVAALDTIVRQFQEKLAESRAQLSKRGILLSGITVSETARINAERITALLQVRLDSLLEGFELHGVLLDAELTRDIITGLLAQRSTMIKQTADAYDRDPVGKGLVGTGPYQQMVEQHVTMSPASMRAQIDRRRLTVKKNETVQRTVTNVYHVYGHNPRWNTNSTDQSVNSVTMPIDQIFLALRQKIESGIAEGDERNDILDKLQALEKAQGSSSFANRYTEFMAVAANHIQVIYPFIPALTELLHKVLS